MKLKTITTIGLLAFMIAVAWPRLQTTEAAAIIESVVWQGHDFADGTGTGFVVTEEGLSMDTGAFTAVYTSPPVEAAIPFNAVVPQWHATFPTGSTLEILMRTRPASGEWSDWQHIEAHSDWNEPESEALLGDMLTVPAANGVHAFVQFSLSFSRPSSLTSPVVRQVDFTFIDTTQGPTTEELLARQQELDAANGSGQRATGDDYPRPTVIGREVWCTSADCDYTAGLEYHPATHLIVHHTVSSNSSSDWAATVRAIWAFHTYPASDSCSSCRGWGDIGYNYLVDRDGIIYEGHNNEDYLNLDVIGTHAGDANRGGLGTALLGTYTTPEEYPVSDVPPQPMLEAVADLFAWKADQRDIEIYDASVMADPDIFWGLPHIMGHRDVYGGLNTLCPGGHAHELLPWIRDAVAERLNYVSPYVMVDETGPDFTRSNSNWYEGPRGCGDNIHSYYTWSTTDPGASANWGEWQPTIPEDGRYRIEVYAPYCNTGGPETQGATYTVQHADGVDTVVVSHQANVGLWMSLGEFNLTAGSDHTIRLTDLTTTDSGKGVWFDGLRLLKVGEPVDAITHTAPLDGSWTNDPEIEFAWEIETIKTVLTTSLQVSTDAALTNDVVTKTWATAVPTYTHTFTEDGTYTWQASMIISDSGGVTQTVAAAPTLFGLDRTPPTSTFTAIYEMPSTGEYLLTWTGSDALSGITGYTISYRAQGDVDWTNWLTDTTATSGFFAPPNPGTVYEFRSQAQDKADNTEPPPAEPALNTEQAIPLPHAIMLPMITR